MRLRTDDLVWQSIEDEIVALDLRSSNYFRLNGSGATLWTKLAEGSSLEEMVETLLREFSVESDQAKADVDAFIVRLETLDLIVSDS